MAEMLFRFGITRTQEGKLRRLLHRNALNPFALALKVVVVGIGFSILGELLPSVAAVAASMLTGQPAVAIDGGIIVGDRIAIIRDDSGSMIPERPLLDRHITSFQANGMTTEITGVDGFGVSRVDIGNSLLYAVNQRLQAASKPTTIYAFSDFEQTTADFWRSDAEGYRQLREMLAEHGVRFYLGTVRYPPSAELLEIARASGGGLLQVKQEGSNQ
jgi:hypothetical protein